MIVDTSMSTIVLLHRCHVMKHFNRPAHTETVTVHLCVCIVVVVPTHGFLIRIWLHRFCVPPNPEEYILASSQDGRRSTCTNGDNTIVQPGLITRILRGTWTFSRNHSRPSRSRKILIRSHKYLSIHRGKRIKSDLILKTYHRDQTQFLLVDVHESIRPCWVWTRFSSVHDCNNLAVSVLCVTLTCGSCP